MRDEDQIEATLIKKFHREGYYESRGVSIQVASKLGVSSSEYGKAKDILKERAKDPRSPIQFVLHNEVVCLERDFEKVANRIEYLTDEDNVPYDLGGEAEWGNSERRDNP